MANEVSSSALALGPIMVLITLACLMSGCPGERSTSSEGHATADAVAETAEPAPGLGTEEQTAENDSGERKQLIPPYLTISGTTLPADVVLRPGQVVVAYYELAEPLPEGAWLGMVPTSVTTRDAGSNRQAAVEAVPIAGETMGQQAVIQQQEGEFVYRIFLGDGADYDVFLESESWRVASPSP